jgi:hypothetical protein
MREDVMASATALHLAGAARTTELRLAAEPEDFEALGLANEIWVREDGRRTPRSSEHFEWWYFDGLLEDGTVLVVWFGDNWPYGTRRRAVNIELTEPGQPTRRIMRSFDDPGVFSAQQADVRIGPHHFEGDLRTYSIRVDADETGGVGCNLLLHRRVASYRPATGHLISRDRFFAWLVAVPEGAVAGTVSVDGMTREVTGSGYHDHNWGNVSPADLFDNWWWGRGRCGPYTVIAAEIHGKAAVGGSSIPLFFVGDAQRMVVGAHGFDLSVSEGPPVPHPDPKHERPIGSRVSFAAIDGTRAEFRISDRLLTSIDLLSIRSPAIKMAAAIMSKKPWYSRFASPMKLRISGQPTREGEGTLEYFELK